MRMAVSSGAGARAWTSLGVALAMLALAAAWQGSASAAKASTSEEAKIVHFGGEAAKVPTAWPVFHLAERPRMCVRMDRRAVYLGSPGPEQRCPAGAIGRRRAILVDPAAEARVARERARASRVPPAHISAVAEFTGLGFDACTAPSSQSMKAWVDSPYRAVGVYIGGLNRACSQPSLTASWVVAQTAAGWHLIPTYVGLQAPTSSCSSCAKLSAGGAASQGTEAANDAVADAQAIGIGAGSPVYYDMESYARTTSSTNATLTFLAAWTARLHALGYDSGVYSSSASGIADLASRLGTSYLQPDDLWIANWNGQKNTADPYVPASAWSLHQRIHQYLGGHDETWGGVTINVDNNYVEGATVGSSVPSPDDPVGSFDFVASPAPGQVRISGWAFDPNAPSKAIGIRAELGGKPGQVAGARHELGPIATYPRADLFVSHPEAGPNHGFDASFPVVGSGRQRICVYALDVGLGSDTRLGCRAVGVPVPISLLGTSAGGNAVRVSLRCEWPAGVQCPGQILLRARVRLRVAAPRRGRKRLRTRVVRKAIGRRGFRLVGGRSHSFRVPLGGGGQALVREREKLHAQLVVAIPGGRATRSVRLK
jgi:glycoside hydrolase-like protein